MSPLLSVAALALSTSVGFAQDAEAVEEASYRHVPITVGIVPLGGGQNTIHHLDLSLGVAGADRLEGAQLSLAGNLARESARGVQASVGGNIAGEVQGAQLSVGGNLSRGPVRGAQLAVGANVAPSVHGIQHSVGLSLAEEVHGWQASVGAAIAQDVRGVQMAVGPVIADSVQGVQASVGLNLAEQVQGMQFGLLNVAGRAPVQLGIVNVSRDADVQVGLLNINAAGYNHVYAAGGLFDRGAVGLTYGGKRLYSVAEFAVRSEAHRVGLGLGWHQPLGERAYLDVDVVSGSYSASLLDAGSFGGLMLRGRAVVGVEVAGAVAAFAGPTLHSVVLQTGCGCADDDLSPGDVVAGLQAGLRL